MVKIIWTQRSLSDLKVIADYISQDSLRYAVMTVERIINMTQLLVTNPKIGRMVPEAGRVDSIREIILGHYRIIYKISSLQVIHILTVHHTSKRLRQTTLRRSK